MAAHGGAEADYNGVSEAFGGTSCSLTLYIPTEPNELWGWAQAHRRCGCVQLGVNEGSRRRADLSVRPSMHAYTAHITISGFVMNW